VIIRRLNAAGMEQFQQFLDSLTTEQPLSPPNEILQAETTSEELPSQVDIEHKVFGDRISMAEYLDGVLSSTGVRELEKDKGLWAWLSLYFFEELCPTQKDGRRKPGERARWIPVMTDYRKYYRHLLAGPYRIYRAHRDKPSRALALLCGPLDRPGEIVEQIASRQEIVTNKAIVETATKLYVDAATKQPKRGAGGKGLGSPRRFAEILNQFDVTWDLSVMDSSELISFLPNEFARFR
jgi:hypothetical protein